MREVYPLLILLFDEVDLPLARPLLLLLFTLNGELDVFKILLPDQSNDIEHQRYKKAGITPGLSSISK